jgi:hypothetical protein
MAVSAGITVATAVRSSEAPIALPVIRPRHTQGPAKQNVGMIARFFVHDAKWIRILPRYDTVVEQLLALIQVKAGDDYGFRQTGVVSPVPRYGDRRKERKAGE